MRAGVEHSVSGRPGAARPVWRFVLWFGVLIAAFYSVFTLPPAQAPRVNAAIESTLSGYARLTGWVLDLLGEGATVRGQTVSTGRHVIRIIRGCDAMEATALLVAAILASPVSLGRKAAGILVGAPAIAVLNVIRIVSLYYIEIHWPARFDVFHFDVWQPAFIAFAVGGWLMWACWARRGAGRPAGASVAPAGVPR